MATEERDEAAHMLKLFLFGGALFVITLCAMFSGTGLAHREKQNECVAKLADTNRPVVEIKELCR